MKEGYLKMYISHRVLISVVFTCIFTVRVAAQSKFGIYKGTKWCGPDDVSRNHSDLGVLEREDACCRDHDLCDVQIAPKETKLGITNSYFITWVTCDCDDALLACLQSVGSSDARNIGIIFFDLLNLSCLYKDYPETCYSFLGWKFGCTQDTSKPKQWQLREHGGSYIFGRRRRK